MAGGKILVADDSLTIQKVIRLALASEGYEIQAVSDGNQVVAQLSLFRPDIVLVDVSLPGRSALEIKREIAQHSDLARIPFILMSSAFGQINEGEVASLGFAGRLVKPFDPAHLRTVIQGALSRVAAQAGPQLTPSSSSPSTPSNEFGADLWATASPGEPMDSAPDADIRKLTESTIKMSGLDEYSWSLNETSKKDDKPEIMGDSTMSHLQYREPSLEPPKSFLELDDVTFQPEQTSYGMNEQPSFAAAPVPTPAPPTFSEPPFNSAINAAAASAAAFSPPAAPSAEAVPLTNRQIEEIVRKMAKDLLPEIAERIIQQEIHRMLSDPP